MIQFPAGARDFPFFHNVQTNSGVHSTSYSLGTGNPFPENSEEGLSYTVVLH